MQGKKILLAVSGSIAAYKATLLVRLLIKQGAEVQVLMTPYAKEFITPLTLSTLSQKPVLTDFFEQGTGSWHSHVDLGLWADVMLVAPASANTMGKMASGIADNLLLTTYLSAKCPVMLAPAMDLDMYCHPSTTHNIELLRSRGNHILEAASGELASGLVGQGRMQEPEDLVAYLKAYFASEEQLKGKTIVLTAGPTYEAIDPVRFVGNHSSGKMGFAIATELAQRGAKVRLICGPVQLSIDHPRVERIDVTSAEQMYEASMAAFKDADGAVLAAAVSDYTPENVSDIKLKRKGDTLEIRLLPTKDIAAHLGRVKTDKQFLVGFALETNDELTNAIEKKTKKNLDMIVLNSLQDKGAGFKHDTNKVSIIGTDNIAKNFELKPKTEVAIDIVNEIQQAFG